MAFCDFCKKEVTRYRMVMLPGGGSKTTCSDCNGVPIRNRKLTTFPFTTTHLVSGKEIEVKSLSHLRSLEKQHGVSCHAYNSNQPESGWRPDPTEGRGMARIMEMRRQLEARS
jgi:hypothetical protein